MEILNLVLTKALVLIFKNKNVGFNLNGKRVSCFTCTGSVTWSH